MVQSLEPTLAGYSLSDRYALREGRVFLTGIQALARLPIEQLRIDRSAGLDTAALVSGYPGSPLGGFDQEAARAAKQAPELPVVCRPAVNEEFGATAVMGSQLAAEQPDRRYDGVLGIWYGKAPGLDRAGDALRHAVFAGTSRHGGAVALVGDDPAAKSSTLPSSSDATLLDLHMPILYPGDVQEALDLGRHAVALSRASGLWTAMKIVAAVADGSGTVELSPDRVRPVIPTVEVDGRSYQCHPDGRLLTPHTLDIERELREVRSVLAQRYGVDNGLNRVTVDPPDAWIGLVATGYTYHELLEALRRLGLRTPDEIRGAGIRLLEMRMPVPFDPGTVRRFARGLSEIVVVEEKNPTLEWLVKDALYDGVDRPTVLGKTHPDGRPLMRSYGILDADAILPGLRERLAARLGDRLAPPPAPEREKVLIPLEVARSPYFCSGCPHNWSTKVPDGTLVGAGIGCHGMVLLMEPDRVGDVMGVTAMGNEGLQWIGMAPFVERPHAVQNLGDGTFFHSGQLAVQAAVAAGADMTFKLLYNGTVAMTGGQDAVGGVGVPELATILLAHGVADVLVTTDDLGDYDGVELPEGPRGRVQVWDRTRMVEAQEHLATIPGVTVLIHDQACAAQTRRLRKRGAVPTPAERTVINHRICEGCGHCGEVSGCLSVQPLDTPLGRKTTIDQSSCNLDFSCLHGECPSFMTVVPAADARRSRVSRVLGALPFGRDGSGTRGPRADLPLPAPVVPVDELSIRFAGIGGTGVVTIAQIVGTAALLDGWDVRGLDQTGLSQKAGPVVSDLRLSRRGAPPSNLLGAGEADVIVAFDELVAAGDKFLTVASPERTVVIASTSQTPTGSMVGHPERVHPPETTLRARLQGRSRPELDRWVDAGAITRSLLGDAAPANVFMLGVAVQAGCIPVAPADIEEAIDLNGVAVESNLAAFRWGRQWVVDPAAVEAAAGLPAGGAVDVVVPPLPHALARRVDAVGAGTDLGDVLAMLVGDLVAYQDAAYAAGFLDTVERVAAAESAVAAGSTRLTETVARMLHKLLAYKDEYEVARLMLAPEATAAVEAVGGPGAAAAWRLHPPLLRRLGLEHKIELPTWTAPGFRALQRGRRLRGTPLDPFGRTPLRRLERELPVEYRRVIDRLLARLTADDLDEAVAIAALPDQVRGYEDIKLRRIERYRGELTERLARWEA